MFEDSRLNKQIQEKYRSLMEINPSAETLLVGYNSRYKDIKSNKKLFLIEEDNLVSQLLMKENLKHRTFNKKENSSSADLNLSKSAKNDTLKFDNPYFKYPRFDLNGVQGHDELLHLVGAVIEFEKYYWQDVTSFLREVYPLRTNSPLEKIDNLMMNMIVMQDNKPPAVLVYFYDFYRRGDKDHISDSAFSAFKEIAFFLSDVIEALEGSDYSETNVSFRFLRGIVADFKIASLKRKKI